MTCSLIVIPSPPLGGIGVIVIEGSRGTVTRSVEGWGQGHGGGMQGWYFAVELGRVRGQSPNSRLRVTLMRVRWQWIRFERT